MLFFKGKKNKNERKKALRFSSRAIFILSIVVSLLIHLGSYFNLEKYRQWRGDGNKIPLNVKKQVPIKIKYAEKPKAPVEKPKKILETPQEKTERPDKADYFGKTDHTAKKQTKIARDKIKNEKAANPGQKGVKKAQKKAGKSGAKKTSPKTLNPPKPIFGSGPYKLTTKPPAKARNAYESLLNNSYSELAGEVDAGYQDYVDDKIEDGDRIDINTQEYRYIGYFTNMRKAIELVWIYPSSAWRRGIQGTVGLEFAINKNGTTSDIKVIKTSGYDVLDDAIVEAIKLASPFAPLPDGFNKKRLVVSGNFSYVLNGYAVSR